jgi:hypothetical protein
MVDGGWEEALATNKHTLHEVSFYTPKLKNHGRFYSLLIRGFIVIGYYQKIFERSKKVRRLKSNKGNSFRICALGANSRRKASVEFKTYIVGVPSGWEI